MLIKGVQDYNRSYGIKQQEMDIIQTVHYSEPNTLIELNKEELIINYLNNIRTRQILDDNIDYLEINSWQTFNISDINYIKTITKDYYEYQANINSEYIEGGSKLITFYISWSAKQNKYVIKTLKY